VTGLLTLGGHTVGRAGTLRALVHGLCSGDSDTDAPDLPVLSLDKAVLCDHGEADSTLGAWDAADAAVWANTSPRGWSDGPTSVAGGAVDGGYIIVEEGGEDENKDHNVVVDDEHNDDEEVVGFGEDADEQGLVTSAGAWLASLDKRYVISAFFWRRCCAAWK
jgi:hypothetical protein